MTPTAGVQRLRFFACVPPRAAFSRIAASRQRNVQTARSCLSRAPTQNLGKRIRLIGGVGLGATLALTSLLLAQQLSHSAKATSPKDCARFPYRYIWASLLRISEICFRAFVESGSQSNLSWSSGASCQHLSR